MTGGLEGRCSVQLSYEGMRSPRASMPQGRQADVRHGVSDGSLDPCHGDIRGDRGSDQVRAAPGDDRVRGGRGDDTLNGGSARQVVRCGPGLNDRLVADRRDRFVGCERVVRR